MVHQCFLQLNLWLSRDGVGVRCTDRSVLEKCTATVRELAPKCKVEVLRLGQDHLVQDFAGNPVEYNIHHLNRRAAGVYYTLFAQVLSSGWQVHRVERHADGEVAQFVRQPTDSIASQSNSAP